MSCGTSSQECCFKLSASHFMSWNCHGLKIWWKKLGRKKPNACFIELAKFIQGCLFQKQHTSRAQASMFLLWLSTVNSKAKYTLTSCVKEWVSSLHLALMIIHLLHCRKCLDLLNNYKPSYSDLQKCMTAAKNPPPTIQFMQNNYCQGHYLIFRSFQLCLLVISPWETDTNQYFISGSKNVA